MNEKLIKARNDRHWSIDRVAEKIGVSRTTYLRWEHGDQFPHGYSISRACNVFNMSAEQLGFVSSKSGNDVDRRDFLQTLGAVGAELIVPSQPATNFEPWERFLKVLKRPSAIDETTLSHLEILAQNTWQLIPDVTGVVSNELRDYAVNQLSGVTDLLDGSLTDSVRKRLTSIGGEFSMIAASMSANLRDFNKAQLYYKASIEASRESGNQSLEAIGLASLAIRLTHLNKPKKAFPLIQESRRLAADRGTTTIRTWLAAVEAEIQANLKNHVACFRALDYAEHVPQQYLPGEDPYMTTFSPSLFAGYKGVCHMQFGESDVAYKVLHEALTCLNTPSISRRCYILTDLASACIQRKEIEEACKYARQALALTVQAKSPALWQRINDIRQQLQAWKEIQNVKDFNNLLREVRPG